MSLRIQVVTLVIRLRHRIPEPQDAKDSNGHELNQY